MPSPESIPELTTTPRVPQPTQILGTEEREHAAKLSPGGIKRFAQEAAEKLVGKEYIERTDPDHFQYRVEGPPVPVKTGKEVVGLGDYEDPVDPYGLQAGVTMHHMGQIPAMPVQRKKDTPITKVPEQKSPRKQERIVPTDPEPIDAGSRAPSRGSTVHTLSGLRRRDEDDRRRRQEEERRRQEERDREAQRRRNLPHPPPFSLGTRVPSIPEEREQEEKKSDTGIRLTLADLKRKLRVTGPTRDMYPMPVASGPVIVQGGPGQAQKQAQPSQIIVKQTVKQVVGAEKKSRKKKVKAGERSSLKRIKNEYSTAKKKVKKDIIAAKKKYYAQENEKIKKLPTKERVAARKKLKAEIKKKQIELTKSMPSTGRMKYNDVAALIRKIKQLKW
jgi:hypothetical protein